MLLDLSLPNDIKNKLLFAFIAKKYNLIYDLQEYIINYYNNLLDKLLWNSIKLAHNLCLQEYPTNYESSKGGGNFLIDNTTLWNYKLEYRKSGISFICEYTVYKN